MKAIVVEMWVLLAYSEIQSIIENFLSITVASIIKFPGVKRECVGKVIRWCDAVYIKNSVQEYNDTTIEILIHIDEEKFIC